MPEARNMVEMRSASSIGGIPTAPPMMKGIRTVAPNMVRYCWIPRRMAIPIFGREPMG